MTDTIKLTLEFRSSFVRELWTDEAGGSDELKEPAVLDHYRRNRISLRKAAELLGLSYRKIMTLLSGYKIPVLQYEGHRFRLLA